MPEPPVPAAPNVLDDPTSERFQALLRDPRLFIRQHDPYTAAIWMALLKPTSVILQGARERMLRMGEQPPPSDEPGEEQSPDDPLAIVTMGEAMVARALMGDQKAQANVADRIEGKVGLRKGDEDPDAARNRGESLMMIRDILKAWESASSRPAQIEDGKITDVTPVDGTG
jgi:hypothetical protein